jgi:DNA-binding beta-propeller fold protein YncE
MKSRFFPLAFCLVVIFSLSLLLFMRPAPVLSVEGFASPESVATDAQGQRIFVSNIGVKLSPTDKDGDGFISELSPNGSIVKPFFTPKGVLNAPKGLAITQNTVYVTDIDRVVGFDINSGKQVFSLDFSSTGSSLLNDLVMIDDRTLLVTTSDLGKVYRISIAEKKFSPLSGNIPGANGIAYFPLTQKVLVNGLGEKFDGKGAVYMASLKDSIPVFQRLNAPTGYLDGLAFIDDHTVIYSDWVSLQKPTPGVVKIYDISSSKTSKLKLPIEGHGTADFYYDSSKKQVWLPLTLDGKIITLKIN